MDLQFSSIPVSKANHMAKSDIKVGVFVWRGGAGAGGDGGESIPFWIQGRKQKFYQFKSSRASMHVCGLSLAM